MTRKRASIRIGKEAFSLMILLQTYMASWWQNIKSASSQSAHLPITAVSNRNGGINNGLFILISTRPMTTEKAISMYYTRNQIEEVFGIGKGNGKLLPLRTQGSVYKDANIPGVAVKK